MSDTAQTKRGRGRPRSQASEDAILGATLKLLAEGGYNAVTVDKVAAMASASKTTIYRRWPTKENLVIAAFELTELLTVPRKRKMVDNLVEIIWQFSQFMQNTPLGGVLPALAAERQHNPELDEALAPLMKSRREPLIAVIERGLEKGELIPGTDPEFVADLCMGPVEIRGVTLHMPVTKKYIQQVVDTALASLLTK
ncbi:MAG: TetR/AcrR family transcriptional regulator [Halioglobus sp.]